MYACATCPETFCPMHSTSAHAQKPCPAAGAGGDTLAIGTMVASSDMSNVEPFVMRSHTHPAENRVNHLRHILDNRLYAQWGENPRAMQRIVEMLYIWAPDCGLPKRGFIQRERNQVAEWKGNDVPAPFRRILIKDDATLVHKFPKPHLDFWYFTIQVGDHLRDALYQAAPRLLAISKSIRVNPERGTVTAGCHFSGAGVATLFVVLTILNRIARGSDLPDATEEQKRIDRRAYADQIMIMSKEEQVFLNRAWASVLDKIQGPGARLDANDNRNLDRLLMENMEAYLGALNYIAANSVFNRSSRCKWRGLGMQGGGRGGGDGRGRGRQRPMQQRPAQRRSTQQRRPQAQRQQPQYTYQAPRQQQQQQPQYWSQSQQQRPVYGYQAPRQQQQQQVSPYLNPPQYQQPAYYQQQGGAPQGGWNPY